MATVSNTPRPGYIWDSTDNVWCYNQFMAQPTCEVCGKKVSYYSVKCMECWNKIKRKSYYCVDCGKQVTQADVKRCMPCWRKFNKGQDKALYTRRAKIKKKYKLTLEQYEKMLTAQDNKCAICRLDQSEFKNPLCVDHDRACCSGDISCGKCVRGLLCSGCNIGIGGLKDNEFNILSALDYVRKYTMNNKESSNGVQ